MTTIVKPGYVLIFRRFRRTKSGKLLDAWKYGLQGWPIQVPASKA